MYKAVLLIICLQLFHSASASDDCDTGLVDWNDYELTLRNIRGYYRKEVFPSVDASLACLLDSNRTFPSGEPGAIAVYWFYRSELKAPGADNTDRMRVQLWQKAIPNSTFAKFAGLRLMYADAWNARGNRYANETSKDQFRRFKEKLTSTENAILSSDNSLRDTPVSHNLLLAVILDIRGKSESSRQVFENGVRKWPNYYHFYEVFVSRLLPKWRGSWEAVDEFINYWSSQLKEQENDSFYARLYYFVHYQQAVNPHTTRIDWGRMKRSLKSLYSKYPVSAHHEIAASYACIFSDVEFYKEVTTKYTVLNTATWLQNTTLKDCNEHISSLGN